MSDTVLPPIVVRNSIWRKDGVIHMETMAPGARRERGRRIMVDAKHYDAALRKRDEARKELDDAEIRWASLLAASANREADLGKEVRAWTELANYETKRADSLRQRVAELEGALRVVESWKLPASGQYWSKDQGGGEISYEAAFGTNGSRDYMRGIARAALKGIG